MRINTIVLAVIIALALTGGVVYAQVQSIEDIEAPTPQFQDHGGVTPWFWIGVQTVFSAGYNIETTAGGFRNYGGDNETWASFNLAFVDSHYVTPKFYQVPKDLDPDTWTGSFTLLNFTSRINNYDSSGSLVETNSPAWLAEITGKGMQIGFFSQAASLLGGVDDENRGSNKDVKPMTAIYGGNKVLNLGAGQLGQIYYEKNNDSNTVTSFSTGNAIQNGGALMYIGYGKQELFNVFLTMLSEGNVNSVVKDSQGNSQYKGFAGVIDFGVSPFGLITDDEKPFTFNVTGNAIAALSNFSSLRSPHDKDNYGFGIKADVGVWLVDNMVLSPVFAFDGKMNTDNDFFYKVGGGLSLRFSGMRWVNDEWGDLYNNGYDVTSRAFTGNERFADTRYENNKILKYAYAQVYAAYSEKSDFNMLFRLEEPDGNAGFHDKLGAMVELRLYNLKEKNMESSWELQGRVSWDINIKQHMVTPYLRGYVNKDEVVKFRIGAYANFIPFTGFELCYTSANLNWNANTDNKPMSHYNTIGDAGRIELLVILKSDDNRPQVPKRMSDWNYPDVIQNY